MRRRALTLSAPLAALVCMQVLVIQPAVAQTGAPHCAAGEVPRFVYGVAELQT